MMRILVVDGSRVLPTLVGKVGPSDAEIETADDFKQAEQILKDRPPDAVIANVSADGLPWGRFKSLCEDQFPSIPVLFESCVHKSAEEAGLGLLDEFSSFITKPYALSELRSEIDRLVACVRASQGSRAVTEIQTQH